MSRKLHLDELLTIVLTSIKSLFPIEKVKKEMILTTGMTILETCLGHFSKHYEKRTFDSFLIRLVTRRVLSTIGKSLIFFLTSGTNCSSKSFACLK